MILFLTTIRNFGEGYLQRLSPLGSSENENLIRLLKKKNITLTVQECFGRHTRVTVTVENIKRI